MANRQNADACQPSFAAYVRGGVHKGQIAGDIIMADLLDPRRSLIHKSLLDVHKRLGPDKPHKRVETKKEKVDDNSVDLNGMAIQAVSDPSQQAQLPATSQNIEHAVQQLRGLSAGRQHRLAGPCQ
jgi:hypothetical protein